jgi:hypothetical protein
MEEHPSYEEVIRLVNVSDENVIALYLHGSFLYGTHTADSGICFFTYSPTA